MLSPDWFVDPVNGNDDTGDGLSFTTAFATTLKAVSEATSGDTIALCATGTEMIETVEDSVAAKQEDYMSSLDSSDAFSIDGQFTRNMIYPFIWYRPDWRDFV